MRFGTFSHGSKKKIGGGRRNLSEMKHGELEKKLDAEVSFWVRASRAKLTGYCCCFTCGNPHPWKDMDAGHYIGRANRGTRWDLRNIRPQCTKCNCYEEGQHHKFRANLINEIGEDEVLDLEHIADGYEKTKMPREWLIDQIERWRNKNASLKKEMKE